MLKMRSYFERVEALLRRSLGVSLSAKAQMHVRPAPPTAHGPLGEDGVPSSDEEILSFGDEIPDGELPGAEDFQDWSELKKKMAAGKPGAGGPGVEHDEL